jgi:hypothetical protein
MESKKIVCNNKKNMDTKAKIIDCQTMKNQVKIKLMKKDRRNILMEKRKLTGKEMS